VNDPLSELLLVSGVRSAMISRARLGAPFGVRAGGVPRSIFHLVVRGEGWIGVAAGERHPIREGDIAVLPHGHSHDITWAQRCSVRPLSSLPLEDGFGLPVVTNGFDVEFDLVCGTFGFGFPAHEWVITPLPELLIVRKSTNSNYLADTIAALESELASQALGSALVANRLIEVLVVHVLRAWATRHPGRAAGWLGAMTDPSLHGAFRTLTDAPASWSVAGMARGAALSRSRFHEVFCQQLGRSPNEWLVTWRVAVAQDALRRGANTTEAAERAGYASKATFGRAFKRVTGVSPGSWRASVVT